MKRILYILVLFALPLAAQESDHRTDVPGVPAKEESPAPDLQELKEKAESGDLAAAQQLYTQYALAGDAEHAKEWADRYLKELTQKAESGDARAMMVLATNYLHGKDYTTPDLAQAVTWFNRAAESGEPAAAFILGDIFARKGDQGTAQEHYQKAYAEYGKLAPENTNALYWMGYMEQNGLGTEKNPASGIARLEQAADAGNEWAWAQLFKTYAKGIGTEVDMPKAVSYARKLADTGQDGLMAWATACAYLQGQGVEKDEQTGEHYLDLAASANIPPAITLKGDRLLKQGKMAEAYGYFNQAASMGEPYAMVEAGRMLLYGAEGVEKDEARGLSLLQVACDRYDSPKAPYVLATYYDSIGEPQLANSWYAVASDRGVVEAMARRGLLHINPASGLSWSPTLMYKWWKTGSNAGDPDCTLYLRLFLYGFIPLVLILAFGLPLFIVNKMNKRAMEKQKQENAQK